jgi:hypothetical protein
LTNLHNIQKNLQFWQSIAEVLFFLFRFHYYMHVLVPSMS